MNMNNKASALFDSELAYFRAGSRCERILHGELSCLQGFEQLASGCVLHNVSWDGPALDMGRWIQSVENKFGAIGASKCRFYLSGGIHSSELELIEHGFEKATEMGLVANLNAINNKQELIRGELRAINDQKSQLAKKELYRQSIKGPDGHNMNDGCFADFEQIKNRSGYMTSYLYWLDGQAVGAVSMSMNNSFSRIKNLFVHPDLRGKGLGGNIVDLFMHKASEQGAKWLGVYAAKGNNSYQLYHSRGMYDVLEQVEWSKAL